MPELRHVQVVPYELGRTGDGVWGNAPFLIVQVKRANDMGWTSTYYLGEDRMHELFLRLGEHFAKKALGA